MPDTQKKLKKAAARILAAAALLGAMSFAQAEEPVEWEYRQIGNTGAEITASTGTLTSAETSDSEMVSVTIRGDTAVVTAKKGAVGTAEILLNGTDRIQVPVGYTTFLFDGDSLTVYEGSDTNYEITGIRADGA